MITSKTARNLLNLILFQTGWLACVLYPPGLATVGLILVFLGGLHLALVSQQRISELQFIGFGVVLGGLMDTFWFRTGGVLALDSGEEVLAAPPPWLIAIWAIFMTTLCHSLDWISQRQWLPWALAPPLPAPPLPIGPPASSV